MHSKNKLMLTGKGDTTTQVPRGVQPLPNETTNTLMRYSTAITHVLTLLVENVTGMIHTNAFAD